MGLYYRLRPDHTIEPCSMMEMSAQERRVALTRVGFVEVSTVFLMIDHNFYQEGDPILFETMLIPFDIDYQERYRTWDEALIGHDKACRAAWLFQWEGFVYELKAWTRICIRLISSQWSRLRQSWDSWRSE